MKKILFLSCAALLMLAGCASENQTAKINGKSIEDVVEAMTLEQKAALVCGSNRTRGQADNAPQIGRNDQLVPGAAGVTTGFDSLGITQMCLSDGPAGLRINPKREGDTVNTYYCTGFPVGTVMASTWNQDLVQQEGAAMGNEVLEYGADVLLAPGMNIQRNPLCGRNFEYYSEDPVLSGKTAAAFVRGVQSNGVGVSVKHFIANNQETNRNQNDARMSVRALREIYLRNFEIAIKEGEPWTIMSSYNQLNGEYTAAEKDLLTTIVRGEWGFKGFVMTDWGGGKQPVKSIAAGNDLLEPSGDAQAIIAAVKNGSLAESDLDACVKNILGIMVKSPRFKAYQYSNKPDLKAHAQVTRDAAAEGMILLKNDNSTLPLGSNVKNVALFGMPSYNYSAGGTGSGAVNKAYTVSLTEGLTNAGYVFNQDLANIYVASKAKQTAEFQKKMEELVKQNPQYGMFMGMMGGQTFTDPELAQKDIEKAAAASDVAIVTIGRQAGEGSDRKNVKGDWNLTDQEAAMISSVTEAFKEHGKKTVVVLNIGGPIETASWKGVPDAILLTWQAGQEGGNTVADILSGKVNPSGKLAVTFPIAYLDNPSSANFPYDYSRPFGGFGMMGGPGQGGQKRPGQGGHQGKPGQPNGAQGQPGGPKPAGQPGGAPAQGGQKPAAEQAQQPAPAPMQAEPQGNEKSVDYTNYEEGIYVGYRYFDTFGKDVSYPFGYGLSYTTFEYSAPSVAASNGGYTVGITVKNTGSVAGKEAVEVYASAPANAAGEPAQELVTFGKTRLLQPGESETLTMKFGNKDLCWFDEARSAWILDAGDYKVSFSASSRDPRQTATIKVAKEKVVEKVNDVLHPQQPINEIKPQQ